MHPAALVMANVTVDKREQSGWFVSRLVIHGILWLVRTVSQLVSDNKDAATRSMLNRLLNNLLISPSNDFVNVCISEAKQGRLL